MRWKAALRDGWDGGREGEADGLLMHLEQAALSENSYGLPITLPHYGRLMRARVAG